MKKCRFCFPLDKLNRSIVIDQTNNFYTIASIGPIIEGYCLLCSKSHFSSCGDIPGNLFEEFSALKKRIKEIFVKNYNGYIFFEHGKTKACCKDGDDAHCYHAHLHCLPINMDILSALIKQLGEPIKITSHQEISKYINDEPYLYYETRKGSFLWRAPLDLKQQFFRWIIAEKLGVTQKADWKIDPNWNGTRITYKKLFPLFK